MSNLAYIEYYTVDEWKQWEGDWELIYGVPYAMAPSPMIDHQYIVGRIFRFFDEKFDDCKECKVLVESDFYISKETVVKPDAMVFCKKFKKYVDKAPEIIFEVVSPSSSKRDEIIKYELYKQEGVKYFVLVYPKKRNIKIFRNVLYEFEPEYIEEEFDGDKFIFDLEKCKVEFEKNYLFEK